MSQNNNSPLVRTWVLRIFITVVLLVGGWPVPWPGHAADMMLNSSAVVTVDHYPVLASGQGARLGTAILLMLNQGDHVRVLNRKGGWLRVLTPEEVHGVVQVKGLKPAPSSVRPEPLPDSLKGDLEDFLRRFREAVASGQFFQLAPLLEPGGLFLQGQFFPDAAQNPEFQKPRAMPLWYASDVSLTLGTAWEVLMTGTDPPPVQLGFDEATGSWRILPPGAKTEISATAEKESALLPRHLQALHLDPLAQLVRGFPVKLEGGPEPETFMEDPRSQPMAWVYQVGKDRYRLEPYKHVGIVLVVTQHPGQGLRLKAVATQSP